MKVCSLKAAAGRQAPWLYALQMPGIASSRHSHTLFQLVQDHLIQVKINWNADDCMRRLPGRR